ncbi:heme-binding protein [Xinfangfangia sp. CPCC 101601]|uniref:Heme-binding protein n=1 Tax=Pseudogemmobacter lacusdianii TaxID=3069608 RepID=A0ABU0VYI7_9RHOB|nr:heme-binding protein [Xinfangfangia sp. CPCC 101601]MDQ2066779.1 heme-binding protein [Xinfangfangia sp. CPCC 101601]
MSDVFPATPELEAETKTLVFAQFDERTALALGLKLVEMAQAEALPVVINIRSADRCYFHAAMPGATPLNDLWAARKSATALLFQQPSLLVGNRHRDRGETLAKHGLPEAGYADHGGAVPIWLRGIGVVACATVSGLPQVDDHRLVVRVIQELISAS